jgi:hypothetical protein
LDQALATNNHQQIYYHAINVAFLNFVAFDNPERAIDMAALALRHCEKSPRDIWNLATQAEANLYLGHRDRALELYRQLPEQGVEPWQLTSTGLQASQIARKLNDRALAEVFDVIFSPNSRRVNKIFISYSHQDTEWMERFHRIMKPYLRAAETDLDLWVDTRGIRAGDKWFEQITAALNSSGIAVLLVSAHFLA